MVPSKGLAATKTATSASGPGSAASRATAAIRQAIQAAPSAWFSIDPRTLALFRVALALLLLGDMMRRVRGLPFWYDEAGLLPVRAVGQVAERTDRFSIFFTIVDGGQVAWVFFGIALVYLSLLIGYRTRVCQVLALLAVLSLQTRVHDVCNGGDYVLCALLWWSLFLPLGKRFSLDALRVAAKRQPGLRPPRSARLPWADPFRDVRPVWSLAVFAALVQLSAIYYFNAVHKTGATWRDGTAIYYFVWQERILTGFGLLAREHMPLWGSKALTYFTLAIEYGLPGFILLPFGLRITRRFAVFGIIALHVGIAMMANLGVFSYVMMVFGMLLWTRYDWNALELWLAKRKKVAVVYYDPKNIGHARWVTAICDLDWLGRFRFVRIQKRHHKDPPVGMTATMRTTGLGVIAPTDPKGRAGDDAKTRVLSGLPLGRYLSRPLAWLCVWHRRSQTDALHATKAPILPYADGAMRVVRFAYLTLRETAVVALLVVAVGQALNENPAVPKPMQVRNRPAWLRTAVDLTRLQQGWRMFAPDAPMTETGIVIDAETVDGRHIDPIMQGGDSVAFPGVDRVPVQSGMPTFFVGYQYRLSGNAAWRAELKRWLETYHIRTGRPEDELKRYVVYRIDQNSPRPGEPGPTKIKARVIIQSPTKRSR